MTKTATPDAQPRNSIFEIFAYFWTKLQKFRIIFEIIISFNICLIEIFCIFEPKNKKNRGFECKILCKSYLREMRRVFILSMSWIIFFGSVVDHFFAQKRNNKRSKKSERVASLMDKTVKRITNDYFDELIKIGKIHSFDISKIFKNFLITWPVIWDHVDGDHVVIMFWK